MRGQITIAQGFLVGGLNNCGCCELADGNMIRVSISSKWPKGDYHVWPDKPQIPDDLSNRLVRMRLIKISIQVIQKIDAMETKYIGGCAYLGLAQLPQRLQAWILALFTWTTTLAA